MRGVVLVGHGSLRPGSGAAMIRLAARAREAGVAALSGAGFLNYSRPTLAQALARCAARGAREVVVQPYFLVPGKFVSVDLPRQVRAAQAALPALALRLARPFGDHPALARLVLRRATEAAYMARVAQLAVAGGPAADEPWDAADAGPTGLLIMAHGSPNPAANGPIYAVAERVRHARAYDRAEVCFMELNQPSIPAAVDALVADGIRRVIAVPYFLQMGGHVASDLPELIGAAQARHPQADILLAEHLAYDPLLLDVIAARVGEAWGG